jgi:mono/diheme cytochrome c family protein
LAGTTSAAIGAEASGGEALYEKSCAGCHGPDGKGNAKMAKIVGDKGPNIVGKENG